MKKKYFVCQVCGEKFTDGWEHVFDMTKWPYKFKDKAHADYFKRLEMGGFTGKCFCGAWIHITCSGENSWEASCPCCNFLFDED